MMKEGQALPKKIFVPLLNKKLINEELKEAPNKASP
jgi:hypothetical protein